MRFLHTSDWHIGKLLRGRSRLDEQEAVRREILDIAIRERIDCLLLSGDLYDSHAPSPDAERLVYLFFSELLGKGIAAVIIGGNHDHPKRLAAIRALLDRLQIYVRPEPARPDAGGVISFSTASQQARIAVLPFVPEKKIVDACQLMGPEEEWYSAYAENIAAMFLRLAESFSPQTINLLVAHMFVHGGQTSGSEREIHVAQPYAVSPQRFPGGVHYIALGHLHRPQEIGAPSPCHYAGSPLQLDFGEHGQEKRVVFVEAHPGKPARIESIPLTAGRKLRYVSGTLEELASRAPEFGDDFLHVTVRAEERVPGIADRVHELLPNAVDVRTEHLTQVVPGETPRPTKPQDMFAAFYRGQHGSEPSAGLAELFRELYDEVVHEADPA